MCTDLSETNTLVLLRLFFFLTSPLTFFSFFFFLFSSLSASLLIHLQYYRLNQASLKIPGLLSFCMF